MRRLLATALAIIVLAAPVAWAQEPPPAQPTGTERARIEWNKSNDIDLHVFDDAGNEAYFGSPSAIPEATLSSDVTSSGGPERFNDQQDPSTRHFRYEACYFSEGATAADQGPTEVRVTLSDPGRAPRQSVVTLNQRNDCLPLGESLGPPPPPGPSPPQQQPVLGTVQTGPPPPVQGTSVNVGVVKGKVRIKRRGSSRFEELDGVEQIPVGSTIDTTAGRVRLTSAAGKSGATKVAEFYEGAFRVKQGKGSPVTELELTGGNFASCKAKGEASAAAKKPVRRLWGSGKGSFRTRGRHAAATVRGTQWLTQDSCAGTLVRVKKGTVTVRDLTKKRDFSVKAGKSYLAR